MQPTSDPPPKRRRGPGKPWKPGTSGNSLGRLDGKRYREICAELASELGGEDKLTASQRLIIDQIGKLKARSGQRDPVRIANAIAKLVKQLGIDRKREPKPAPTIKDYAAARMAPGAPGNAAGASTGGGRHSASPDAPERTGDAPARAAAP